VSPTPLLGGLVNHAGQHRNWRRADELWCRLVNILGVQPRSIEFCAYAKAHMLSGRPHVAACKLDEMLNKKLPLYSKIAVDHFQCLLITFHSSLLATDGNRVQGAIARGRSAVVQSSKQERQAWQNMVDATKLLKGSPTDVFLHDVLIGWKEKTQSVMKDWDNHAAGSNYLCPVDD